VPALSDRDVLTLDAIAQQILPDGDDGPGAREAHVLDYIRGQLEGPWGQGARMYRQPPFVRPEDGGHGWQSALTPAEAFRYGLGALNAHTLAFLGARFEDLAETEQEGVLRELEAGSIDTFEEISSAQFFELVRRSVIEGFLSDPVYGGNHVKAGWNWIGYSAPKPARRG
jgi:gluconate 2-dehydrogenase gamma chain